LTAEPRAAAPSPNRPLPPPPAQAGDEDPALTTFFRPNAGAAGRGAGAGAGGDFVSRHRARAVLVDMEEGVVSALLRSPVGGLFESSLRLTDVSGAGNNWACGYASYGPTYCRGALDLVRRSLEACESPQAFLVLHSLGGGTGSGFGSYLLEQLADAFPEQYRFTASLMPSRNDDVVTSPYNALLATARLIECADAVLPIDNQRLLDIVAAATVRAAVGAGGLAPWRRPADERARARRVGRPPRRALDVTVASFPPHFPTPPIRAGLPAQKQVRTADRNATTVAAIGPVHRGPPGRGTARPPAGAGPAPASTSAGSAAPAGADRGADAAAVPAALSDVLARADAVLDAVSHGLAAAADARAPPGAARPASRSAAPGAPARGAPAAAARGRAPPPGRAGAAAAVARGAGTSAAGPVRGAAAAAGTPGAQRGAAAPARGGVKTTGRGAAAAGGGGRASGAGGSRPPSSDVRASAAEATPGPPTGSVARGESLAPLPSGDGRAAGGVAHGVDGDDRMHAGGADDSGDGAEPDVVATTRRSGTPYDAMNTLVANMVSWVGRAAECRRGPRRR
jgi:hypothetical protein